MSWIFSFVWHTQHHLSVSSTSFAWHTQHHFEQSENIIAAPCGTNERGYGFAVNDVLRNDVMLRINDVVLRTNGILPLT